MTGTKIDITVVMVVQSLPPLPSGGAEIQALRIAAALQPKGIDVLFITPGLGRVKGFANLDGLKIQRLHSPLNYILDLLFLIQKKRPLPKTVIEYDDLAQPHNTISRKIGWGARLRYTIFLLNAYLFLRARRNDFQIIHSHTIEWPGYVSAVLSKWLKKKLIIKDSTMNGISNILRFPDGKRKQQLIIGRGNFIAMTRVIREAFLQAGIAEKKIFSVSNGIQTDNLYKVNYQRGEKVLFVGNLYQQPAKGLDILLKAWTLVAAELPQASLTIAGDGDIPAYLEYIEHLKISGSVIFTGKHSHVSALMIESDVFVLPSRREGMPNVLMEAMLRAVPCVATDISGSQDLISDQVNGLLVPPADVQRLAGAIVQVLTDRQLARELGMKARKTIIDAYNIDRVADKYAQLYRQLLTEENTA